MEGYMSVIENLVRQDEELAPGYIMTRSGFEFKTPNVRRLGIISTPSYLSHPDVRQVRDGPGGGD